MPPPDIAYFLPFESIIPTLHFCEESVLPCLVDKQIRFPDIVIVFEDSSFLLSFRPRCAEGIVKSRSLTTKAVAKTIATKTRIINIEVSF